MAKVFLVFLILLVSNCKSEALELVVPYGAGGPTDYMTRHIADHVNQTTDLRLVIINKPGASQNLGFKHFVDCRSCLLVASSSMITNRELVPESYPNNLLTVARPVFYLGTSVEVVLASSMLMVKEWNQIVQMSKKNMIRIGYGGKGSISYKAMVLMCEELVLCMGVPYKSGSYGLQDLFAGRIDLYSVPSYGVEGATSGGRARPIRKLNLDSWWKLFANNVDSRTLLILRGSLNALPSDFYDKFGLVR